MLGVVKVFRETLSIFGLYAADPTIFDGLAVPEGVNKQSVVDTIILDLSCFEVLYPDSAFMKGVIKVWSEKELPVWEAMYKTTQFEYDPISNYDRKEEWTETRITNDEVTGKDSREGTQLGKIAAFNSPDLCDKDSYNTTDETDHRRTTTGNDTFTRSGFARGNIGVTTTQEMIEAERNVVKFNIVDYIVDSFKTRFCILVY